MNHIDAYAEYKRIVGDDDNGRLFSEEEYANYCRKIVPLRLKNRLYVSWQNQNRLDCKLIGPETKCLCQCRYKNHQSDVADPNAPGARKLKCKVSFLPKTMKLVLKFSDVRVLGSTMSTHRDLDK